MKTIIAIIVILFFALVMSVNAQERHGSLNLTNNYRIRVNLKPRVLIIEQDAGTVRHRYYSNSAFEPRMQYLGEETYHDGRKVLDTYKEND